jgi:hypothetical protein
MALPTRGSTRRALTASASKLDKRTSEYSKRLSEHWQLRALEYYDRIGELRYASHFYARQLSRVRYFPARLEPDGNLEPITDGEPVERLNQIQDPGGGRSRIQYDYGRLMFVTGEGVLFGSSLSDQDDPQKWRFLWKDEVEIKDGTAERLDAQHKPTGEKGVAYRFWNPHPRHSDEPDAPMRAIMDIAEELLVLTASVMATATTRMTNGIMVIPQEISPNPVEPIGDEDAENNPFLADYTQHVMAQIENPGSAEAKVPFLLEGAYDYIDKLRHVPTHDPQNDYLEKELRIEAIKRMALGLDMPPEVLLGMTDANHWTAKQVMHDMWRSHGVVKAEQFADDLSEAYLRPALKEDNYDGWENVVIGYDDSQVVISPDRSEDADKALDRMAISFKGYRELKGIPESMEPSSEEKAFLASIKLRQPVELEDGELVLPQRGPVPSANGNAPAGDSPPDPGTRLTSRQEARTASANILGAASLAMMRCRELAGIRIRHKCRDCAPGEPDSLVASSMGPAEVPDPMKLVHGGADGLRSLLSEWGFEGTQASSLCQMVEVYAAKTLFEPRQPDLPSGFMAQVEKAREVSDAVAS